MTAHNPHLFIPSVVPGPVQLSVVNDGQVLASLIVDEMIAWQTLYGFPFTLFWSASIPSNLIEGMVVGVDGVTFDADHDVCLCGNRPKSLFLAVE